MAEYASKGLANGVGMFCDMTDMECRNRSHAGNIFFNRETVPFSA